MNHAAFLSILKPQSCSPAYLKVKDMLAWHAKNGRKTMSAVFSYHAEHFPTDHPERFKWPMSALLVEGYLEYAAKNMLDWSEFGHEYSPAAVRFRMRHMGFADASYAKDFKKLAAALARAFEEEA